jgi:hypothetical protein
MDGALLIPLSLLAREIEVCMRKSDDYRITAGMKLLEVQQRVQAGEAGVITWSAWIKANLNRSTRDVQKCIALARSANPQAALERERQVRREGMARVRDAAHVGRVQQIGTDKSPLAELRGSLEIPTRLPLDADVLDLYRELTKFLDQLGTDQDTWKKFNRVANERQHLGDQERLLIARRLQFIGAMFLDYGRKIIAPTTEPVSMNTESTVRPKTDLLEKTDVLGRGNWVDAGPSVTTPAVPVSQSTHGVNWFGRARGL